MRMQMALVSIAHTHSRPVVWYPRHAALKRGDNDIEILREVFGVAAIQFPLDDRRDLPDLQRRPASRRRLSGSTISARIADDVPAIRCTCSCSTCRIRRNSCPLSYRCARARRPGARGRRTPGTAPSCELRRADKRLCGMVIPMLMSGWFPGSASGCTRSSCPFKKMMSREIGT